MFSNTLICYIIYNVEIQVDARNDSNFEQEIRNCEIEQQILQKYEMYSEEQSSGYNDTTKTLVNYVDDDTAEDYLSKIYGTYISENGQSMVINMFDYNGEEYGIKSISIDNRDNLIITATIYKLNDSNHSNIPFLYEANVPYTDTDSYGNEFEKKIDLVLTISLIIIKNNRNIIEVKIMQEYQINSTKMYKIIRQENKKHIFHYAPWIMIVISIIGFFLLKNFFSIHMVPGVMDEDHIQGCKSVTILLSSLFAFLLYIIPTICAQRYVDLLFNYKSTEQLIITDGAIENTYNPIWESMYFCKRRVRILCCEITRLEWYPNHRCLKIYAPVSITHFLSGSRSYPKETIKKTRIITGKKGFRVFYAYYNDFEHFIKQIEMLSGKSVIECTGHTRLREKK